MKKGFTMIELIFVIVILGILAAVAIPRMNATRDDAEAVKAATNLNVAMSDISTYYISQGQFTDMNKMTGVLKDDKGGVIANGLEGHLIVKNQDCFKVTAVETAGDVPAHIVIEKGTSTNAICATSAAQPGIKSLLTSSFSYSTVDTANNNTPITKTMGDANPATAKGYVRVGGTGVNFEGTTPATK